MNEQRETWINKSDWGDGPWQAEPDRIEWRTHGFPCLMLRNPSAGHWCGYVGVPPGHLWHGLDMSTLMGWNEGDPSPDVHGGVTFAAACMEDERPQRERVCHVPRPGESDDVWWVGFDFHHAWDTAPGHDADNRARAEKARAEGDWETARIFSSGVIEDDQVYRDERYVRAQVESVANQALAVAEEET